MAEDRIYVSDPLVADSCTSDIRNIICSLYYLSNEAKSVGMESVSDIISSAIIKIKAVIDNEKPRFDNMILHDDVLEILKFINIYVRENHETQGDIVEALKSIKRK